MVVSSSVRRSWFVPSRPGLVPSSLRGDDVHHSANVRASAANTEQALWVLLELAGGWRVVFTSKGEWMRDTDRHRGWLVRRQLARRERRRPPLR